jgi:hypothetical protein
LFVSPIEDRTERPPFWHSWDYQGRLQVVPNILTKQVLQDARKKWQKPWEQCICVEGDYFEGDCSQ